MYNLKRPATNNNMRVNDVLCPYCHGLIYVPVYCVSISCRYCKQLIDLGCKIPDLQKGDDRIKHSDFYLKREHRLEVAKMYVGNAIISGTFQGDLYSSGTVKILEQGAFYGKISCCKFLIKKGGIFEGTIQLTYDRNLETIPVKNFYQHIMK